MAWCCPGKSTTKNRHAPTASVGEQTDSASTKSLVMGDFARVGTGEVGVNRSNHP